MPAPSRRASMRKPSNLISRIQPSPAGALGTGLAGQGSNSISWCSVPVGADRMSGRSPSGGGLRQSCPAEQSNDRRAAHDA
jgi:hypothetical protein